jgi:F-type H+-transporting ATPase subunit gamma
MAKARAIVKRRKAVRNIKKITKTMQMIATAKFQKSLRRAVGTKPYTQKVRELVKELAANIGDIEHPLLRRPTDADRKKKIAVVVLTSNRGLAGAYNGSVLRAANVFLKQQESTGVSIDLYVGGKKGASYFNFQKRAITQRLDLGDAPKFEDVEKLADELMGRFIRAEVDAVYVAYMNFISASTQKPEILNLLPLAGVEAEKKQSVITQVQTIYEFSPSPKELLDELLPQTVKAALFQAFLDATTSEHVSRMIAMKSATDNADKMVKSLTMQYNRARQSQITTELSEIMGGVEAMKA